MLSKKTVKLSAISLLLLPLISGCTPFGSLFKAEKPKEIEIKTVEVPLPITHPTMPRPIDLKEPVWYVVSKQNLDEFLQRIEKEAGTVVFFAMSPGDYELMAYNMQELRRYIREMNQIIVYYRTVTDGQRNKPKGKEEEKPDAK